MAGTEIAVSLIQVIAFFLPAWAIMVQVFVRTVDKVPFEEYPRSTPFVAAVAALIIISLFQFTLAATQILEFLSRQMLSIEGTEPLRDGMINIYYGTATFVTLGFGMFAVALMGKLETRLFYHILTVTLAYCVVILLAWETVGGPFRETFPSRVSILVAIVFIADILYIESVSEWNIVQETIDDIFS